MPKFYLNTYGPLVASKAGREACQKHGLPPFIDGSIRREPDLEHEFPSISCLCRADKFAPRLRANDIVAYMTTKAKYGTPSAHRRLTAVLRVQVSLATHADAAKWYRDRNLSLPSNCWVHGNPARRLDESHRIYRAKSCVGDAQTRREWDAIYRARAMRYGTFVVCEALFRDLFWYAPIIEDHHLTHSFGKKPGTQNPGPLPARKFMQFLKQFGISVPPSRP